MSRVLKVYKNHFWKFFNKLPENVKQKFDYVFEIIITVELIPKKFFKHIEKGIFEIRVEVGGNIYRIFCFLDERKLVILLHGIQKKTQKLLRKDIEKAISLRKEYFNEKEESNNSK